MTAHDELDIHAAASLVTTAAFDTARSTASKRLLDWLQTSGAVNVPPNLAKPEAVTAVLLVADQQDPRYQVLGAFHRRWACDVVAILATALVSRRGEKPPKRTPDVIAVQYALSVGATWNDIGAATGTSGPTAHVRYRDKVRE